MTKFDTKYPMVECPDGKARCFYQGAQRNNYSDRWYGQVHGMENGKPFTVAGYVMSDPETTEATFYPNPESKNYSKVMPKHNPIVEGETKTYPTAKSEVDYASWTDEDRIAYNNRPSIDLSVAFPPPS